jgi:hypothetical protein
VYENDSVRYCETDAAKNVELLVAQHVAEGHRRAAEHVAAARDADVHRRAAVEEHLLERPLTRALAGMSVCVSGAWKSMIGARLAEVGRGGRDDRLRRDRVQCRTRPCSS